MGTRPVTKREQVIAMLQAEAGVWVSDVRFLDIVADIDKLIKIINELKNGGWDVASRVTQESYEVAGGVSLRVVTQYMYKPPATASGWACTSCGSVYTSVSGGDLGDATLDPNHRQAACWRCKKKTFWRLVK